MSRPGLRQQISMAAVAGDADNINKQARKTRTNWLKSPERANWVTNKQTANVFLPNIFTLGARPRWGCGPRRLVPRTGPSTLHVRIMFVFMFMFM